MKCIRHSHSFKAPKCLIFGLSFLTRFCFSNPALFILLTQWTLDMYNGLLRRFKKRKALPLVFYNYGLCTKSLPCINSIQLRNFKWSTKKFNCFIFHNWTHFILNYGDDSTAPRVLLAENNFFSLDLLKTFVLNILLKWWRTNHALAPLWIISFTFFFAVRFLFLFFNLI